MKLNKITILCLIIAGLLAGGVLVARAAGFVSFENGNKVIIWDNVKLVNHGLRLSGIGIKDQTDAAPGVIEITDKDIYIKGTMGFSCPSYPFRMDCQSMLGNLGSNTFLKADSISGAQSLTLASIQSPIDLRATPGTSIDIHGKVILKSGGNLIITDITSLPPATNSVFVTELRPTVIKDISSGLIFPAILLDEGAGLYTKRVINITVTAP